MDKLYTVTDAAPKRIAGKRVRPGDTMRLAEPVARYDAEVGHLAEVVEGATDGEGQTSEGDGVALEPIALPADGIARDYALDGRA